jgi:hypothetical protein
MGMKRALLLGLAGLGLFATPGRAQEREDSFKWYLGAQGGVLGFQTPAQTRAWVPSVGGTLLVNARRTGLLISVDEALGSDELTGFADNTAVSSGGIREVEFDRIRKYSAVLTAYPVRGPTQPYFGLGFGLMQVINPEPTGVFSTPVQASNAKAQADERSTDGFISFVAGLQFRLGRWVGFGQYQLASAASRGHLLRGSTTALTGGLRFSLGGAKEGSKGGGY